MTGTDFDVIDLDHLQSAGSLKWSHFPGTIGAFVAEMDFGTAPAVTRALHAAIDEGLFGYLPGKLSSAMSAACANWQQTRFGWDVSADQVHPVADVLSALKTTIQHFSRPDAPVILPTPAYMPFLTVPPSMGREVIQVPMLATAEGYRMDLDGLDAAYRAGGDLLILCNPYNPLGLVFTEAELLAVSEVVGRHGGRVFADEIHAAVVYPGARHIPYATLSPATAAHTVTATSASKSFNLPGLKCAQIILTNEADAALWERIGFEASLGAANLGVVASTAAYTDGGPWLDTVLDYLDGNRRLLGELVSEHLPGVRSTVPQGTYIGWLDCRELALDGSPADFFRTEGGVSLTDGVACGQGGEGFVRMVFATPRPILEQAVTAMGQALLRR